MKQNLIFKTKIFPGTICDQIYNSPACALFVFLIYLISLANFSHAQQENTNNSQSKQQELQKVRFKIKFILWIDTIGMTMKENYAHTVVYLDYSSTKN